MSWPTAKAKQIIKEIRRHQLEQLRRPPVFRVSAPTANRQPPAVYYLCPDINTPVGGVRVIYRHVDALNALGIPAAVVHRRPNFSCTWFYHETRVMAASKVTLTPSDVLVIPEYYGHHLAEIPDGPRVVLFNQNAYQTFTGSLAASPAAPYPNTDRIEAIIVVSHDNAEYMRYAFPRTRVELIRDSVNLQMFYPSARPPGQVLAFMPRKRQKDCEQVLGLLSLRGSLEAWELLKINDFSEKETASALRRSSLFLSFSEQEGFGMPPAEAMASGCYVIGFTGLAGREFFDRDFSMPIENDDILAFAKGVESTIADFSLDPGRIRELGLRASAEISETYSPTMQLADIEQFFLEFISPAA
jgi:glycosyltransferase involved in cell wall biosynthesis